MYACSYMPCLVAQSCLTLCSPVDCSLPGSSIHGISQARILEWVAMPSSRGSSRPRDQTQVSCIAGRFFTDWATREALTCSHRERILFKGRITRGHGGVWGERQKLGMSRRQEHCSPFEIFASFITVKVFILNCWLGDFPGGPVFKILYFHSKEHGFHPWSGN